MLAQHMVHDGGVDFRGKGVVEFDPAGQRRPHHDVALGVSPDVREVVAGVGRFALMDDERQQPEMGGRR